MKPRIRAVLAFLIIATGIAALAPSAHAADPITAESWAQLPASVTKAQQVWYPSNTLGMGLHSTTLISAEKCGSNYTIEALYGGGTAVKNKPSFDIQQVAGGDCDLEPHTFWGRPLAELSSSAPVAAGMPRRTSPSRAMTAVRASARTSRPTAV